jgi:hypothetical protein
LNRAKEKKTLMKMNIYRVLEVKGQKLLFFFCTQINFNEFNFHFSVCCFDQSVLLWSKLFLIGLFNLRARAAEVWPGQSNKHSRQKNAVSTLRSQVSGKVQLLKSTIVYKIYSPANISSIVNFKSLMALDIVVLSEQEK